MNKFFYLSKEHAKKNIIWVYEESEKRNENYLEDYSEDAYEYIAETIPNCPWYDSLTDSVIEMPVNIKVEIGLITLSEGEYINEENKIIYTSKPDNIINGYWDVSERKWKERLSSVDVSNYYLEEKKKIFIKEVDAIQKIIFMEQKGLLIEGDTSEGVREYLNKINPYNSTEINILNEVPRPIILDKYRL